MKALHAILILSAMATAPAVAAADDVDYTRGIIYVNEDWYGHQNSTLNHLLPDDPDGNYWHYRIFQTENPGHELGCTNQYGAIWKGRLYLIAKQERDPGADITGGRITVADARTLKMLHQAERIDPSGAQCDGRGFVGVDEHKGYVSTSNGVWILDLDTYEITGQVSGTSNPNAGDDKPNTDPTGSLYHGQCGMMVAAEGRVFVAHQQYGMLVVDPGADKVTDVLSMDIVEKGAGIGSIVRSKDGILWLSVAKNKQGTGATLPYLVRVDPATLDHEVVRVPDGMYPPANSWYAWTPDSFVASAQHNVLYWKGGPNRWFSGTRIYRYDIDRGEISLHIDLEADGENWNIYGCSLGCDPITDELYMALYHEFGTPTYVTRRYSPAGVKIRDYDMIMNYWFPSLPLFPEGQAQSGITDMEAPAGAGITVAGGEIRITGAEGATAELVNMAGLCVLREVIVSADHRISTAGIARGVYVVRAGGETRKVLL